MPFGTCRRLLSGPPEADGLSECALLGTVMAPEQHPLRQYSPELSLEVRYFSARVMTKIKDSFEKEKEKYREMILKGKSIAYLRSIKETKKERLKKVKNDRRNKRAIYDSLDKPDESLESEIDSIEEKIFEISSQISSIYEVILEEIEAGEEDEGSKNGAFDRQYDPLEHVSARELEQYGVDLSPVRRSVRIERWLDKNCSGWIAEEIPSKHKREIESHFELSKSTAEKDIQRVRDKKRMEKIKYRLNQNYEDWTKGEINSEAKKHLTEDLNISEGQLNGYLEELIRIEEERSAHLRSGS